MKQQKTKFILYIVIIPLLLVIANRVMGVTLNYWQRFGPAKIIANEEVYHELNQGLAAASEKIQGKINLVTDAQGSDQLFGIKGLFKKNHRFKLAEFNYEQIDLSELDPVQPLGIEVATSLAKDRILKLKLIYNETKQSSPVNTNLPIGINKHRQTLQENTKQQQKGVTFFVSVVPFFTPPQVFEPRGHILVMVEDQNAQAFRFVSDGIAIHPDYYDLALEAKGLTPTQNGAYETVGNILAKHFQVDSLHWQQFVTQGKMNLAQQIASAGAEQVKF